MSEAEFAKIVRRIRADYPNCLAEQWQFREWYEEFKGVDFDVAMEACQEMLRVWNYPPITAQFWARIKQVEEWRKKREEDKARARLEEADPVEVEKSKTAARRYSRFVRYLMENRIKWAKWSREEFEEKLLEFEKEHPNWKPKPKRKDQGRGMRRIGDVLRDSDVFP